VDGDIGPIRWGIGGLQTFRHILIALIGVLGLPGQPAANDIRAVIHGRQYRRARKIEVSRWSVRPLVGVRKTRIIGRTGNELIKLVLSRNRSPVIDRADLGHLNTDI
jgi:hypothetical protein